MLKGTLINALFVAMFSFVASATFANSSSFSGTFTGLNDHITTGTVSIMKTENGGSVLILGDDFSLDGAPDPSVAFGKDGKYLSETNLGNMTRINGFQVYEIPDTLDWSAYDEVYIWCEQFSVGLGVANIK